MAIIQRNSSKSKATKQGRSPILILAIAVTAIAILFFFCSLLSTNAYYSSSNSKPKSHSHSREEIGKRNYLYWGNRIDCPGKHCHSCEGLGHQESSLRCALEEALFLQRYFTCSITASILFNYMLLNHNSCFLFCCRTFVMPSRMCINPIHNKKGILHHSTNATTTTTTSEEERLLVSICLDLFFFCFHFFIFFH